MPWSALIGGVLIGVAATALLWFNGRIAGVSGIVNGLASRAAGERGWRIAFLLGLASGGVLVMKLTGQAAASPSSTPVLLLAGLLVGFGTRLGSGCTSGHGVCGLGRLSLRSLVAVMVFMAAAIATVYVGRHVSGVVA